MNRNGDATIRWVVFWGIVSVVANSTLTTWGSISAIVAGAFAVSGVIWGICKHYRRKIALKNPCAFYYEPTRDSKTYKHTTNASREKKYLNVTINFKTEVYVEFLFIKFEGDNPPRIENVYEWHMGEGYDNPNYTIYQAEDGGWNWTFNTPLHKQRDTYLRIGLKYVADKPGVKTLMIFLGCAEREARKHLSLPLEVT